MKNFIGFLCLCFMSDLSFGQDSTSQIAIIPEPVKVTENPGHFLLPQNIIIEAPSQPEMRQVISFLSDRLSAPTGISVVVKNSDPSAAVRLVLNKKEDNVI